MRITRPRAPALVEKDALCWEHLDVRFYIALLGVKSTGLLQPREISPSSSFRRAMSGALGANIIPESIVGLAPRCPGS